MTDLQKFLETLEITKGISEISLKDVNTAFRKLALRLHPDKAGEGNTQAFQELVNAHAKLKNYVITHGNNLCETVDDDIEKFFRENFEQFNYPCENKGSFTVHIEDMLAETWKTQIEILLGKPNVVVNDKGTECDRNWKLLYSGIELTLHIYCNPRNKKGSKILIQGSSQSLLCSYIFEELPQIYKLVCENKPLPLRIKGRSTRVVVSQLVKCIQCKKSLSHK